MQEFMEMKREGLGTQAISQLTGYDRKTVRRYVLRPETAPGLWPAIAGAEQTGPAQGVFGRPVEAGGWNAQVLLREIRQRGYQGGCTILKDWLQWIEALRFRTSRRFEAWLPRWNSPQRRGLPKIWQAQRRDRFDIRQVRFCRAPLDPFPDAVVIPSNPGKVRFLQDPISLVT
jgi:hypothetical protein